MKKLISCLAALAAFSIAFPASAASEFCKGFLEGYKSIKGDMALVPMCPLEPLTPLGSTPFREGLKAGIIAASK